MNEDVGVEDENLCQFLVFGTDWLGVKAVGHAAPPGFNILHEILMRIQEFKSQVPAWVRNPSLLLEDDLS